MPIILSSEKNNIENIVIKYFSNIGDNFNKYDIDHPIFEIEYIKYIDDFNLSLKIKMLEYNEKYNGIVDVFIINKYNVSEYYKETFTFFYNSSVIYRKMPFKLKQDNDINKYKIPKIIHQSYKTNFLHPNNYIAAMSWKKMNLNYEYKYWDDNSVIELIKKNFDDTVLKAYNLVYAGAYKSDIFRLCVLYLEGGIWTDISAICQYPIDLLIDSSLDLLICKDSPSQVENPNIYQAFIITIPQNPIIKSILDFTVDRVIRNEYYDNNLYPFLKENGLGITGPTVFGLGLNLYLGNPVNKFFEECSIVKNELNIKIINHIPGSILDKNIQIIKTKYENFSNDRYNQHYHILLKNGYIFKKQIFDKIIDNSDLYLYQCWIQSEYVSKNMENAINTWKEHYSNWNYKLMTDEKIKQMLKLDQEFNNLLLAYNSIKPFAYKADIIRLYVLYKTGGIYSDIDSICYKSCENLCQKNDLILCVDINQNNIFNGFIYCKKGELFIKFMIDKIVQKILNREMTSDDLSITGPKLFGNCLNEYFNIKRPFVAKNYLIRGRRIKLLSYVFNLPFPKGSWNITCKDSKIINGNILETYARKINGNYTFNKIKFNSSDELTNVDGNIIGNTSLDYTECNGSGLVYDTETYAVILSSKYKEYNEEKLLLDGNDFSIMYKNGDIFV
jgi:mannosyltransferase OCH1-like enzyme